MRRCFVLLILLCSGHSLYAQESVNMVDRLGIEQEIVRLEKRINNLMKRRPYVLHTYRISDLYQFQVFSLWADGPIIKENYLDYTFLQKIKHPGYFNIGRPPRKYPSRRHNKKKNYLYCETLITDRFGNLIATADAAIIYSINNYVKNMNYIELAKILFDGKIDFIFQLGCDHSDRYWFGLKDNKLYAIKILMGQTMIYTWDEFITNYFDGWKTSKCK